MSNPILGLKIRFQDLQHMKSSSGLPLSRVFGAVKQSKSEVERRGYILTGRVRMTYGRSRRKPGTLWSIGCEFRRTERGKHRVYWICIPHSG